MGNASLWAIVGNAGWMVKFVLLLLLGTSVYAWAIILFKYLSFRRTNRDSEIFLELFWEDRRFENIYEKSKTLLKSPLAQIFISAYEEIMKYKKSSNPDPKEDFSVNGIENIERCIASVKAEEEARLESHLTFLASTASAAPFVGLFGTVWGIMEAFHSIGHAGSASLSVVAPGISEALIATAMGLFAAIPAVVAYNFFLNRIRVFISQMDAFSAEFLNITQRHIF
ncbi:MAG TPA: protein TolQ [bacterium]